MSIPILEVVRPGAFSTIQDLGRPGYQHMGVSPGGAMDRFAAQIANILAGNDTSRSVLEITLLGPSLRVCGDTTVGIAGADLNAVINGKSVKPWSSVTVKAGDQIEFRGRVSGSRVYLAVNGGFDVPLVLGSCSTDARTKIGGFDGRQIRRGDILLAASPAGIRSRPFGGRSLKSSDVELYYPPDEPIRVIAFLDRTLLGEKAFDLFFRQDYKVRTESDRMGCRLDGQPIELSQPENGSGWSEPTAAGTVQILPSGQPIVLMRDRQTVGGYAKIGTVVSVDLDRLAQSAPGDMVHFEPIDLTSAQRLLYMQRKLIRYISISNA